MMVANPSEKGGAYESAHNIFRKERALW